MDSGIRQYDSHSFAFIDDPDEETATTDVKDPNWKWPAYDEVQDRRGRMKFAKRDNASKPRRKGFPFQVIYRNAVDIALWPDAVMITLKSPHLMAILSQYLTDVKGLQYLEQLAVDGRSVYVLLERLKKHQISKSSAEESSTNLDGLLPPEKGPLSQNDDNRTINFFATHAQDVVPPEADSHGAGQTVEEARLQEARLHLDHLLRFLEEEYSTVALRQRHMKEDKCVAFDMLWVFLTSGTVVVYRCNYSQEQVCAKVLHNSYEHTDSSGKVFFVTLAVWDYNGVVYRQCTADRMIPEFGGEEPFDTLAVFPIDMDRTTSAEALKAEFEAKGRRFQQLAMRSSNCFMQYNGPTFRVMNNKIFEEKADGRVMIDLRSFAVMNPNYPMNNAKPPVSSEAYHHERNNPSCKKQRTLAAPSPTDNPAEEFIIFAPAIAYGFSFTLKKWGAFRVTGFYEIDFDTNAFDALVMEPGIKQLLCSVVSQFIATETISSAGPSPSMEDLPRVDPIASKGEGSIFLCYGPPGTGKTLTAESLAENLRRPLWSLTVCELGTTPGELEKTLLSVLDIAAMWKAVLLLDEADIYLEKRVASTDVNRNAMTGVFMRLLEYYRGVLFLTTNRITTFDEAFRSRISLVLYYPKLNKETRAQIWKAALARVQAGKGEEVKVGAEFVVDMARHKMNGRDIRNAIHTAQTLARSKKEELQEKHLRLVMSVLTKTSKILDAALQDV